METKDFIGLILLMVATCGSVLMACLSQRLREAMFFLMTFVIVETEKVDINFFSQYWYRGSTRGVEVSLVDVLAFGVLAGCLLFPRRGQSRIYWPASFGWMAFFFAFSCVVVLFSTPKIYGVFELSKMVRGLVFFLAAAMFIRSPRELGILVFALCCAVCLEGVLAARQRLVEQLYRVGGSMDHPNSLSMYLCLVTPVLAAAIHADFPKWLRTFAMASVGCATVAILFTISRAGMPAFFLMVLATTAICMQWTITPKKIILTAVVLLAAGGLFFKSWDLLKERYEQSTLSEEYMDDAAVESRGYFLRLAKVIMADRPLGIGLNNWSYWVSKKYGAELNTPYEDYDDLAYTPDKTILPSFNYAAPAHSLAALTVGELGIPGLVIFLLLWLRWFHMGARFLWRRTPAPMQRLGVGIFFGLLGVFLQSLTEWVYRQTQIYLTFHLLAGALAALCYARRRELWQSVPAPMTVPDVEFAATAARGQVCV